MKLKLYIYRSLQGSHFQTAARILNLPALYKTMRNADNYFNLFFPPITCNNLYAGLVVKQTSYLLVLIQRWHTTNIRFSRRTVQRRLELSQVAMTLQPSLEVVCPVKSYAVQEGVVILGRAVDLWPASSVKRRIYSAFN